MARLVKKSFTLNGHRTSVALEAAYWRWLEHMARPGPLAQLIRSFDVARGRDQALSSTLRLGVLTYLQQHLPPSLRPVLTDDTEAQNQKK